MEGGDSLVNRSENVRHHWRAVREQMLPTNIFPSVEDRARKLGEFS